MAVQRITSPDCASYGYQARAYIGEGRRLTRFFADDAHGGAERARKLAEAADKQLQRQAKKIKRQAGA